MNAGAGAHERIYRTLLSMYPSQFRAAYGDQVAQLFGDQLRDEGAAKTWLRALQDLPKAAISEHLRRNRTEAHSLTLAPT
ncbi:MAG: hypothetical protein ABIP53_12390, partial [Candidatus Limnocylindrales bacterium]